MNIDVEDNVETQVDEEIVIIEERDKHTYLYIGIAMALGIALGGLIGSIMTTNKWEDNYNHLNKRYEEAEAERLQLSQTLDAKLSIENDNIKMNLDASAVLKEKEKQIEALIAQNTELEKANADLTVKINNQKGEIGKFKQETQKLTHKTNVQASLFESSRELFNKEQQVDQELAKLQKEQKELLPNLEQFKKECDVFLAGQSWDVKSDACSRQDEVSARLSQIEQLIEVNRLDKQQIKALKDDLGIR